MTERRPLAAARAVTVVLGGHIVVDRVDLAVHRGELVSLIGPNGSGKTTLVRALLGLIAPAAGTIERAPGLKLGYVPQRLTIERSLPLTAERFLALAGRVRRADIDAAMAEAGIAECRGRPVQGLSGGEFQRLLLARALLRDPDLLVLDEPAQGVDVNGQAELYGRIGDIRKRRGCGILMISHDLHLVMAATDVVVCLNRHICCSGKPERIANDPAYLALFGAAAAGMLALYTHRHDHEHDMAGHVHERGHGPGHPHAHGNAAGHG
jgi:zinc transport system ATP-binding protein